MAFHIPLPDRFRVHRELIHTVAQAGVQPPEAWRQLDTQLNEYVALKDTAAERLAEQVVNPKKNVDIAALRAQALAELVGSAHAQASANAIVVNAVEKAMLDAYNPVAHDQYRRVADLFNSAATSFTQAARTVDPEYSAEVIVTVDQDKRDAWTHSAVDAARLDNLLPALIAAAALAGADVYDVNEHLAQQWFHANVDDRAVLALIVGNTNELHLRRLWEAFNTEGGRTNRWGALVKLGAHLGAADLDTFTKCPRPQPLIHRQEQIIGAPKGTVRNVTYDPHDPDFKPEAIDPTRTRLTTV